MVRPLRRRRYSQALLEALEPRRLLSFTLSTLASLKSAVTGSQGSGLVMDADGNLFGTTSKGGAHGYGTVFKIAAGPDSSIITLVSFDGHNGISPRGPLVIDANGNLFGTTVGGGASNKGTIFEVATGTASTITTVASFDGTNGAFPFGGLVVDSSGNLFGTTMGANSAGSKSTLFEVATGSSTITVLATFKSHDQLAGALVFNSAGDIFGTTLRGGPQDRGTIFKLAGSAHTLTTLATFGGTNGSRPNGLIVDGSDNIFGTTNGGGTNGLGTIFELPATSSTLITLASFGSNKAGSRPVGPIVRDADGNLYGLTANGGAHSLGTFFELTATASAPTAVVSFSGKAAGAHPTDVLIHNADGDFFGFTFNGGDNNRGVVFKIHDDSIVFSPPPPPAVKPASFAGLRLTVSGNDITAR